jgi:hypothetical protein
MSASPITVPSQSGTHLGRFALGAVAVAAAIAIVLAMIIAAPKAAQTTSAAGAAQPTWDHGSSSDVSNVPLVSNGSTRLPAFDHGSSSDISNRPLTFSGTGPGFDHGSSSDASNQPLPNGRNRTFRAPVPQ